MAANEPRVLRNQRKIVGEMEVINPEAAGIDIGAEEMLVSVREDRSDQPVRSFGVFTEDLYALADWLVECGVTTVAMEATGVYWIPLYEILDARGLDPRLVDARGVSTRNKKTDVLDCQWLRQLHMHGLLDGAYRPGDEVLPIRSYMRQRRMLVERASSHILHMQKALDQMNVKLHTVISDITGVSGMRIIKAIINGQTNPDELAAMADSRCQNSPETIAKSLFGNYRTEHLFELRQAVELFEFYKAKLRECDDMIEQALTALEVVAPEAQTHRGSARSRRKNELHFDAQQLLHQRLGVDLVAIDGIQTNTALTIATEIGFDVSAWDSAKKFTSWLTLAPNARRSGGKDLKKRRKKISPNRAAQAFRIAAQTLERSKSGLGAFFRRIKQRQGRPAAIRATARKLATIVYSLLKNGSEYKDAGADYYERRYRHRLVKSLERRALSCGYRLVPVADVH